MDFFPSSPPKYPDPSKLAIFEDPDPASYRFIHRDPWGRNFRHNVHAISPSADVFFCRNHLGESTADPTSWVASIRFLGLSSLKLRGRNPNSRPTINFQGRIAVSVGEGNLKKKQGKNSKNSKVPNIFVGRKLLTTL